MKVVFAVSTIFHVEHLKRVYQQWDDAVFLLFSAKESTATQELTEHLARMGARSRHVSEFLAIRERADVMFSVYWQPAFLVMGPETMHVRIMYGYAKDDWNYGDWNRNYDLILAYGPYAEERLKRHAPCISVGHPRAPLPDRSSGKPAQFSVESRALRSNGKRRPLLLYCPTYGALSSLKEFDRVLPELADVYEMAVKLHHLNDTDDCPNLMRLVHEARIRVYDQRTDLFDLLPSSDLVISDHSGAIFDAMLLKKNIVLVDSESMKGRIRDERYEDSANLDIKVRNTLPHYEIGKIVDGIRKALENPPDYQSYLKHLYAGLDTNVPKKIRMESNAAFQRFSGANRQRELIRRLIRFVEKDHRELVILGAGDFGQAVMQWVRNRWNGNICFVDGDPSKHGSKMYGIPVLPPSALDNLVSFRYKCLVATIGGAPLYESLLKRAGFAPGRDYFFAF